MKMSGDQLEVTPLTIANQQSVSGKSFPLALECRTRGAAVADAASWAHDLREELKKQTIDHGAILFRGFPLSTAEDFDAFVAAFDLPNFPYKKSLSNAVRVNWT